MYMCVFIYFSQQGICLMGIVTVTLTRCQLFMADRGSLYFNVAPTATNPLIGEYFNE